jgi:hypothetical protein
MQCNSGQVTIIRALRGHGVDTPVEEPADNQAGCWAGQELVAVLGHTGGGDLQGGGHWVASRKVGQTDYIYCAVTVSSQMPDHAGVRHWWCLDSTAPNSVQGSPFPMVSRRGQDPTIELFIFKQ